jgi:predicted nucleic acid-binding protein
VIDTGILTLYFSGEASVRPIFIEIESGKVNGYVTSVNLSEFHYKTCEKIGEQVANLWFSQCRERLLIIETDGPLSLSAGKEKCRWRSKLSLADCFAVAASKKLNAILYTTDPELKELKDISVRFFKVP